MNNNKVYLGDVVEIQNHLRVPLSKMERQKRKGTIPYYGATGVLDYIDQSIFTGKHILVAEDGSVLTEKDTPVFQLVDGKFWVSNHAHILSCNNEDDLYYIYYALQNTNISEFVSGSVQLKLNKSNLLKIKIPFLQDPILRSKISNFLRDLDKKIEINIQLNQSLEKIAKTIFNSWFVKFDPVKVKKKGEPLTFSKNISDLFPNFLEDSELGKIPKGWNIIKLGDILDILSGHAFKSKDYLDEGIFVLRTKNFHNGIVKKTSKDVFLSENFLKTHKDFICEEFDYHLVMVGASLGDTGMILSDCLPALRNQNMWCFKPKNSKISNFFTKFTVDMVTRKLKSYATGSARDFFTKEDFRNHLLVLPNNQILDQYKIISDLLLKKISKNFEEINLLKQLKEYLSPRLIKGKLRISDAKQTVREATN